MNLSIGKAVFLLCLSAAVGSCDRQKEEISVIPPVTAPLSRTLVGFGVVNVSYTHVAAEPEDGSSSPGYLRRGSVVQVVERRLVKNGGAIESWVLVEGSCRGWLRENLVDIYENEGQAQTAAESLSR